MEGMPPLEQYIVWDVDWGRFTRNWGVEYSNYLTMLYGFETQLEFEEAVNPTVARWNSVLRRMKTHRKRNEWLAENHLTEDDIKQDKIEGSRKKTPQYAIIGGVRVEVPEDIQRGYEPTPKNKEVVVEMTNAGFKVEELVDKMPDDVAEEETEI
jgi:hypothetical protein